MVQSRENVVNIVDADQLILARVRRNLSIMSPTKRPQEIFAHQGLATDLRLSRTLRRALAPGFGKIASFWNERAEVTMRECEALTTVQDCIEFVKGKAGLI